MIRMALLGAGGIARKMAQTVNRMEDACLTAVAARELDRARAFAMEYGIPKAYGSYDEMLSDPEVDLVYIALPHSHHCRWTLAALQAGKHVLCEKAFAVNQCQAKKMIEMARSKGLLLAEAIWTRYMPSRGIIDGILSRGEIGEPVTVSANLGYKIDTHERIIRPELAGGALLDLTVYPLNFASMVFGDRIKSIDAHCILTDTGVDGQDNVMIRYEDGKMASMFTTIYTLTDRTGYVYGREGILEVRNINNPEAIRVWSADRNGPSVVKEYQIPDQISGYEYEVSACARAIREGKTECPEMPHDETLEIMRQMDMIRAQFGLNLG